MVWSHNDQWMVTADHAGFIKYWQTNMNNVKMYQGHKEPIRSIRWDHVTFCDLLQQCSKVYVTISVNCVKPISFTTCYNTVKINLSLMQFIVWVDFLKEFILVYD